MKWDSGQLLNLLNWFVYLDLGQAAMTSAKLYYITSIVVVKLEYLGHTAM